jgi:hypothetical protein
MSFLQFAKSFFFQGFHIHSYFTMVKPMVFGASLLAYLYGHNFP